MILFILSNTMYIDIQGFIQIFWLFLFFNRILEICHMHNFSATISQYKQINLRKIFGNI